MTLWQTEEESIISPIHLNNNINNKLLLNNFWKEKLMILIFSHLDKSDNSSSSSEISINLPSGM